MHATLSSPNYVFSKRYKREEDALKKIGIKVFIWKEFLKLETTKINMIVVSQLLHKGFRDITIDVKIVEHARTATVLFNLPFRLTTTFKVFA